MAVTTSTHENMYYTFLLTQIYCILLELTSRRISRDRKPLRELTQEAFSCLYEFFDLPRLAPWTGPPKYKIAEVLCDQFYMNSEPDFCDPR